MDRLTMFRQACIHHTDRERHILPNVCQKQPRQDLVGMKKF